MGRRTIEGESTYGERLAQALRHMQGRGPEERFDRKAIAKHMGISVTAIGYILSGKNKAFTGPNHVKAAAFLGVRPEWLATGEGPVFAGPASEVEAEGQRLEAVAEKIQSKLRGRPVVAALEKAAATFGPEVARNAELAALEAINQVVRAATAAKQSSPAPAAAKRSSRTTAKHPAGR